MKIIKKFSELLKISCLKLCKGLELSYSTLMRWLGRFVKGRALNVKPGPAKTEPFDINMIKQEVLDLNHHRKRTSGTGLLYEQYRDYISRRDIYQLVCENRKEQNNNMTRIIWHTPGLVWALDEAEFKGYKYQQVRDMSSQYKFPPFIGSLGEEIAVYLDYIFRQYGAPLFFKRDNGGNLNHEAVNAVLNKYQVIPLNSPAYYPQYNGGMEHDQGELKDVLKLALILCDYNPGGHMLTYLKDAANELNHKPRRNLGNNISCRVFFDRKEEFKFGIKKRKAIFNWLKERAAIIIKGIKDAGVRELNTAWRVAVEQWLRIHGHITMKINGRVLPDLSLKISH